MPRAGRASLFRLNTRILPAIVWRPGRRCFRPHGLTMSECIMLQTGRQKRLSKNICAVRQHRRRALFGRRCFVLKGSGELGSPYTLFMVESEGGAGGFRPDISVAAPFVWRCLTSSPVAPVSTPRSSNRTCGSPASGSRTRSHAFTHDGPRPSWVKRTSRKCPYRCESG